MQEVLIITGGSKGIGKGIVTAYLSHGVQVFSIARTINGELSKDGVTQIALDLTRTEQIEQELLKIFNLLDKEKVSKITLINNAGTLGQIGPLDKLNTATIEQAIRLNTIVPFILSSAFIRYLQNWEAKKTIVNITSGAALKPYFGWSVYCSSKAAVNMLVQTIAVEQAGVANSVKVLAISPGVVDTDMQSEIRQSAKQDFRDIGRFLELKKKGLLNDAMAVGKHIYQIANDDGIESGAILRVPGN